MSSSRRYRTNLKLNLAVDAAQPPRQMPNHPISSAQILHRASQINAANHALTNRPTSVQYAHQAPMSSLAPQTPMHRYVQHLSAPNAPLPTPHYAAPRPDPATDSFLDTLVTALVPLLTAQQKDVSARIDTLETVLEEKLGGHVKALKDDASSRTKQLAEAMQKAHSIQQAGTKALGNRVEKIERAITSGFGREDEGSLASRLDAILFTVEELSERVKDPEAIALDQPAAVVVATTPRQYADAAIETESIPFPAVERAIYSEVSVGSNSPIFKTPCRKPEPSRQNVAASPMRQAYSSIGTNTQTPLPPKPPPQFTSSRAETSPVPRLSMASPHRYSSDRMTLVADTEYPEIKSVVDEELSISPQLKPKTIEAEPSQEEDEDAFEYPESPGNNGGVQMRLPFTSSPAVSRSLSAADWSDGAHHDAASDEEEGSGLPLFRPTTSPTIAKQYSIINNKRGSDDGTVASLRHDALGDAHAGPRSSLPQPPILPFHPRPSVSPLPSPASSPSPPPTPAGQRRKAPIRLSIPMDDENLSSPALVSNSLGEVSNPTQGQEEEAPALNLTYEAQVSSPEYEAPNPARDTSVSSPAPVTQSQPKNQPMLPDSSNDDNILPDSEDESELSVTRLITQTFEHLEELQPEVEAEIEHSPLFLPSLSPEISVDSPQVRSPRKIKRVVSSNSSSPSLDTIPKPTISSTNRIPSNTKVPGSIKKPSLSQIASTSTNSPTPTAAVPRSTSPKKVWVPSSPIYISSRSPSPLSDLSDSDPGFDSDSDVHIVPAKKTSTAKNAQTDGPKVAPAASASSASTSAVTPLSTGKTPHINLKHKVLKLKDRKSDQSAAVTRVKKRKVKEPTSLEAMEPPLKRARQRVDDSEHAYEQVRGSVIRKKKANGKERDERSFRGKRKETSGTPGSLTSDSEKGVSGRLRQRAPPPSCKWPPKNVTSDKKFNQRFIECEECANWYHYGCAGVIDLKDARINGDKRFICPPCSGGGANPMVASVNIVCARPDCGEEKEQPDQYFMTDILGRSTKVQSGLGKRYVWLVKWDGYSVKECTWEEEDAMSDPQSFIQQFNKAALKEGVNPEVDQHSTILLRAAIKGGWTDPNA